MCISFLSFDADVIVIYIHLWRVCFYYSLVWAQLQSIMNRCQVKFAQGVKIILFGKNLTETDCRSNCRDTAMLRVVCGSVSASWLQKKKAIIYILFFFFLLPSCAVNGNSLPNSLLCLWIYRSHRLLCTELQECCCEWSGQQRLRLRLLVNFLVQPQVFISCYLLFFFQP